MNDTVIRIIIYTDVPSDVELIEKELKTQKLNILLSPVDGKEAFTEALVRFTPDIVLCDCASRTLTCLDALKLSLLHDPLLPFIIVTGSENENMAVQCMKSGSTDYVLKESIRRLPFAIIKALERKKALQVKEEALRALRETEERYRSLFENNHEIILLVDPKTGAVVDANFSACKYYGWSRREMLTKKITDIDTSHAPLVYERMHLALKESKNSYILEHRLANGVKKDVGVTMAPLFLKRQSLLYWTVHEIVERKIWDKKADCVAEHNI